MDNLDEIIRQAVADVDALAKHIEEQLCKQLAADLVKILSSPFIGTPVSNSYDPLSDPNGYGFIGFLKTEFPNWAFVMAPSLGAQQSIQLIMHDGHRKRIGPFGSTTEMIEFLNQLVDTYELERVVPQYEKKIP